MVLTVTSLFAIYTVCMWLTYDSLMDSELIKYLAYIVGTLLVFGFLLDKIN